MRKVLTAIALIIAGMALAIAVLPTLGIDFSWLSNRYEIEIYQFDEPVRQVIVQGADWDVFINPSFGGDELEVFTSEQSRNYCDVDVTDGVLTVTRTDNRSWLDRLELGREAYPYISLYLPEGSYELLALQTDSGNIYMSYDEGYLAFDTVQLESGSGWIHYNDCPAETITARSGSGDVRLNEVTAGTVDVTTTSGDIDFDSTAVSGELTAETTSGDIWFWDSDAGSLQLKTASGDVWGNLLTPKNFETHTTSGDVDVPDSDKSAGLCSITTSSGDIRLQVDE